MPTPSRGIAVSGYLPPFADGAKIYGENIQSGVITSAHIKDGTIPTTDLANGAVTSAKLATGSVVAVKIGAGAVTSAKIGSAAVVAANIGAGAVTSAKIGSAAVVAANIGAGAVTSAKIGSAAVVKTKMRCTQVTGTITSANVVYAKAHGLSGTPSVVVVTPLPAADEAKNFTSGLVISESAASAAGSTNVYVIGNKAGAKYKAFVLI